MAVGAAAVGGLLWANRDDGSSGSGDSGDSGDSGEDTDAAAAFTPTTAESLRISKWPFYIDEETVGLFETESGLTVAYREDVNDNEEYFARIREPLSRGDDVGADMFIVTDFLVNRLIGLGWLPAGKLALTPLSLLLFGQVSVVGFLANLMAIPWVTLVVAPLALAGVVVPPLWDVAAWALRPLAALLQALAALPFATLSVPAAPLWAGVAGVAHAHRATHRHPPASAPRAHAGCRIAPHDRVHSTGCAGRRVGARAFAGCRDARGHG